MQSVAQAKISTAPNVKTPGVANSVPLANPLGGAQLSDGPEDRATFRRALVESFDPTRRSPTQVAETLDASGEKPLDAKSPLSTPENRRNESATPAEPKGLWQSVKSWGAFAGKVACDVTGITSIYEGVREGDWKKVAIGSCQLAGTALAFTTGAGLGMIVAGAALQNAGTIIQAVASGNPAAIGGAVLAVAGTVVLSKYGAVVSQQIMNKIAPIGKEVLSEGLTKVGQGLGQRIGDGIIAERGAAQLMSMGIEAGKRGAATVCRELDEFVGPAVLAAKKMFGPASKEVGRIASEKISELSIKALTPEIHGVMSKLGVTERVASVVSKELIEKAANAGILGQLGFGGGRALSFMGLGNSALRESILHAAPDLGEEGAKVLAKHLCRAVQQGGHNELLKESLTTGITTGLRNSLKSVLEDPMREAFKGGIAGSVKAFAQKYGIEQFEGKMMQGATSGFDEAYASVLRAHVHAGVAKALDRRSQSEQKSGAGSEVEEATPRAIDKEGPHSVADTNLKRDQTAPPDSDGIRVTTHSRQVIEGNDIVTENWEVTHGSKGIEVRVTGRSGKRAA